MKQPELDLGSLVAYGVIFLVSVAFVNAAAEAVRGYAAQYPNCDRGCQDRWEHATKHVLPLILGRLQA